jgi:CBS domain-containing protein
LVADIPAAAAPEVFRQQAVALMTANEDGPGALRDPVQFPALGYDTIRATDSAQMVLDTMGERNIDALIEVDESGNIVKVITRDQIESALLQELATRTAQ